jgi:hypothetical protein
MGSTLTHLLELSGYARNNVLPAVRRRPSQIRAYPGTAPPGASFSPDFIHPLRASGGFNSVIELAASTCRSECAFAMNPAAIDRTPAPAALSTLISSADPSGRLAGLAFILGSLSPGQYRAFRLSSVLGQLTFSGAQLAVLDLRVVVSFVYSPQLLIPLPWQTPPQAVAIEIGSFGVELTAPLSHFDDPTRCSTRVFANLRQAKWTPQLPPRPAAGQPSNDLLLVLDAYFQDWLKNPLPFLHAPLDLPLTPTLSLVGRNPGSAAVPEIADFAVEAFSVTSAFGFEPALAVAFDVMPGCHGAVEAVEHFIGPSPFGVISDEFIVEKIFIHEWNTGGFYRRMKLRMPLQVEVTRNGTAQLEDAVVDGWNQLLTLDFVAIVTDSNTRRDYIALGGHATANPMTVRMVSDGQTLAASAVGLGPQPLPWIVALNAAASGELDADPDTRNLQLKAYSDGLDHIARPFAFADLANPPPITYTRVEGVSRHVFFLGNLPNVLS